MKITSSAFLHNQEIPSKYTCDGKNINPPLEFWDIPKNTKTLALIVDDPDAPSKTWVHWVVYNIDPSEKNIPENTIPKGAVLGMTDFGKAGYGGPCPPNGVHRYFFKLYALDKELDSLENATKEGLEEITKKHILGQAELIGIYKRK
ncbi:MAG: phosphatidylethanolamine-binding protein [Candidatus Levybacteria bacterium RIFCSPHIGHO2_12_FULL_38_12]|nr:MAG: phosphatidylethanolamine-binding protein [Candidatus Levybacteria bacterium RIFCSPHIGHO2_01_FULL_38_12]OGH22367.1 MAG: phosphatidylethanolamine-binding protein [Candidatus Levybacteria bacterium RIFCSPHIGHO2_02_FULL_37_18]OGH23111.1 MAG: phosphatidylethanolamine-binding protein [Candidatus Levybacteria bacterium RIFCSPHIGHO2_12_FULL_38_12]OGH34565.1 MAG: phosphatidylethanolamine-binding protein [Candidatus Levybacteria bacterium RIFCSPLOWO2_01_FULL_37_20]OGH43681.1 MAG: phosphatidyletha